MSETLETMLEAMPDSYQKTVGFPTYDLLAAAAIPMEELEAQLQETAASWTPPTSPGGSGALRQEPVRPCAQPAHLRIRHPPGDGQRHCQ